MTVAVQNMLLAGATEGRSDLRVRDRPVGMWFLHKRVSFESTYE